MSTNSAQLIVAIDGPAASGKSTVSRRVAERLKIIFVDSGAMYRGMTWKAVREGVDVKDADAVIALMNASTWELGLDGLILTFTIDDEDPTDHLRSAPVRERVSYVAAIPEVRQFMVARLRETATFGDLVMEGRDIGSVVFPETPLKFYLDADPAERARRRHLEQMGKEEGGNVQDVLDSLQRRDTIDSTRSVAPLQIPLGAHVINTTKLTIDEVVEHIVKKVNAARVGS